MKKTKINMLSMADSVDGQGVGSAYIELMSLLKERGKDNFEILLNDKVKNSDIIHSHTIEPRNYFKIKMAKAPTVSYVHFLPDTLDGSIKLPKLAFKVFKKYVIDFYKSADYLVVVNPIFINDMIKAGLKEENIIYIPNFVSKKEFYKMKENEVKEIRKKYSINKNRFTVLGAGQVQTRKGVIDFVEVAKKMPHVDFIWAGGFSFGTITDGHKELQKIIKKPPKNVRFLGIIPRDDMNNLFNAVNLLFVPSYNELFPMTILEACSTNTPILLRDLDLYKDILFNKYYKGSNNIDFVKVIDLLKDNKDEYKKAIEYAKEVSEYYSEENVYKMWEKFYNDILKEK